MHLCLWQAFVFVRWLSGISQSLRTIPPLVSRSCREADIKKHRYNKDLLNKRSEVIPWQSETFAGRALAEKREQGDKEKEEGQNKNYSEENFHGKLVFPQRVFSVVEG